MPRLELSRLLLPDRHLHTLQAMLAQYAPRAEVWAYDNRATGGAHEGSDLDLVLRHPGDPTREPKGWLECKEALKTAHYRCWLKSTYGHICLKAFTAILRRDMWSCRKEHRFDSRPAHLQQGFPP